MALLLTGAMTIAPATNVFAEDASYDVSGCDPVEIVFATANASANIESVYANRFMELVKEYSNDQITFDYTDGGVMGT